VGYRLLEGAVRQRHWPIILVPGSTALVYLGYQTGALAEYLAICALGVVVEVGYRHVRRWHRKAFTRAVPASRAQDGDIPQEAILAQNEHGEEATVCPAGKVLGTHELARLREAVGGAGLVGGPIVRLLKPVPFVPFLVGSAVLAVCFTGSLMWPLIRLTWWLLE